jgi:hypothetical protein
MKHYLLVIWGDVNAEIKGPFKKDQLVTNEAIRIRRERGDGHGLHRLDVTSAGVPKVYDFGARELPEQGD